MSENLGTNFSERKGIEIFSVQMIYVHLFTLNYPLQYAKRLSNIIRVQINIIKWSAKIVKPVGEHPQWFSATFGDIQTFTPLKPLKLYFGMFFALIKKAIGVNINSMR